MRRSRFRSTEPWLLVPALILVVLLPLVIFSRLYDLVHLESHLFPREPHPPVILIVFRIHDQARDQQFEHTHPSLPLIQQIVLIRPRLHDLAPCRILDITQRRPKPFRVGELWDRARRVAEEEKRALGRASESGRCNSGKLEEEVMVVHGKEDVVRFVGVEPLSDLLYMTSGSPPARP